jgi:hypothetical protein
VSTKTFFGKRSQIAIFSPTLLSRLGSFALSPYGSSGVHLSLGVFVDCAEPEGQSDSSLNVARDLFLRVGLNMA